MKSQFVLTPNNASPSASAFRFFHSTSPTQNKSAPTRNLARSSNPLLAAALKFIPGPSRRRLGMTHMFPNGGASSSSTSMSSQRSETDDDKMIAMVLEEEYAKLDGAMAKRLTNLTSIPHVPRINTYFPTYSDATMDHHRLHDRLNAYGLFEVRVSGDGNCQFRALSDQLYRSPEYHKHVRKEIVKQLKACNSLYEGHVPMKYKHYCKKMKKSGEWGDHVTLQAAADKFAAKICLLTSFRDTCFVEIVPQYQAPQRELWLSFWSEIHYNSLYDARDLPSKYKPRKKHWLF
ncbi:OVARIAN TUMOR DOMAIN-containing deubiquitinating enzyme 12-like isoform X1 [Triticum dicoccoides]|nr:OVARIAN TUMOR DOMAIN-containing deubiquitinating enzyme 12-like isoform X1 [Triticum dicoccoides]